MQRPRVCRDVLMLLASFIRSPLFWSLQRSEPARSHRDNLRETRGCSHNSQGLSCQIQAYRSDTLQSPPQLPHEGTDHSFGLPGLSLGGRALSVGVTQGSSKMIFTVSTSKSLCQTSEQPLSR